MHKLFLAATPLLATSLLAQGVPEAAEPNNTTTTATQLLGGGQGSGDITAGDEDWFEISLAGPMDYKIWTSPGFAGQIGDTKVRILDSLGTTQIVDVDDGNTGTHGYYTTFAGTLAGGTYFVAVRGFDAGTVGSYTLDVVLAATGTYVAPGGGPLTPVAEGPEDNDPRNIGGAATVSAPDTLNSGNISTGGGGASYTDPSADYDFYQVTVASSGTLVMETVVGAAAPALGDSVIFIADAAFALLGFDDDSGSGFLSLLNYNVTPGTYNVVVKGWSTGNYDLEIRLVPTLPSGASTVSINAGGCAGTSGTPLLGTRESSTHAGVRPEVPVLGTDFFLDGSSMPANAPVLRVIGLDPLGTPFDLGGLGASGCQIEPDPIDQSFAVADANGNDFWGLGSPASVAFIGLTVEQQLAVLDPGANGLGLTVSNSVSSVFGVSH